MADQLITGTTIIEDKRSEKGEVWSCAGINFQANVSKSWSYDPDFGYVVAGENIVSFNANVNLPQGATIKAAVVYSNVADETWELVRINVGGTTAEILATANTGSTDESISFATVNNHSYYYFFRTSSLDDTDRILGAKITYEF